MLYCRHTQESRSINLNCWPFFFSLFPSDTSSSAYRLHWKLKVISDVWSHSKLKAEELQSPAGSRGIRCLDGNVREIENIYRPFKRQDKKKDSFLFSQPLFSSVKSDCLLHRAALWKVLLPLIALRWKFLISTPLYFPFSGEVLPSHDEGADWKPGVTYNEIPATDCLSAGATMPWHHPFH